MQSASPETIVYAICALAAVLCIALPWIILPWILIRHLGNIERKLDGIYERIGYIQVPDPQV